MKRAFIERSILSISEAPSSDSDQCNDGEPITPIITYSPGKDMLGSSYHGASPSPLYLNPMTDEDWWSRNLSSELKLTLSDDEIHILEEGVRLFMNVNESRKEVMMTLESQNAMLRIDTCKPNEDDDDDDEDGDLIEPICMPLKYLSNLTQSDLSFTITFNSMTKGCQELHLECVTYQQHEIVIASLGAIMGLSRTLPRKKWLPRLKVLPGGNFNSAQGVLSPESLQEEPTFDENSSPDLFAKHAAIHEQEAYFHHDIYDPIHDPDSLEQGMEVALIDFSRGQSSKNLPVMKVLQNKSSIPITYKNGNSAAEYREGLSVHEAFEEYAPQNINPWCANDVCTIASVTEAFGELFGIGFVKAGGNEDSSSFFDSQNELTRSHCYGIIRQDTEECWSPNKRLTAKTSTPRNSISGNNTIRNRSEKMNGQAIHWRALKYDMTFDFLSRRDSRIQTTKSLDECEISRQHKWTKKASIFPNVFVPFKTPTTAPGEQIDLSSIHYYDSDPEFSREQFSRRKSREIKETLDRPKFHLPKKLVGLDYLSDDHVQTIVDIMKSCTLFLLWHPNPTMHFPQSKPRCVKAWIEKGTYLLNKNFIQPKFMWKAVNEENLSFRKLNLPIEKFDLLEVSRIESDINSLDRSSFPLAHQPSCFVIVIKTTSYLFQAPSVEEKEHIVFGLKLVVARLASLLLCRDPAAVQEFFEPMVRIKIGKEPQISSLILKG